MNPCARPWTHSRVSDTVQADPVSILSYDKSLGQGHGANFDEHGNSYTGLSQLQIGFPKDEISNAETRRMSQPH